MYDIKWIRENRAALDDGLVSRGQPPVAESLLALDETRRAAVAGAQGAQERRNAASREIGAAMGRKDAAEAERLKAEVAGLKEVISRGEQAVKESDAKLESALALLPNTPLPEVPVGPDETGNVEYRRHGSKPDIEVPKQHFELGEALGLMDFETAAKLSGARFVVLRGALARMERALGQFMLDLHTGEHGYTEVNPPLLVKTETAYGTGNLPKAADDMFQTTHGLWLTPTAEVSLTNLVRESILEEGALPLRVTALTPCFRAEAGAAGRDTRGMLRQHQFTKCELVSITTPEESLAEHERMLDCAEAVLKRLNLHFRTMTLCTGDIGFASRKTYDIEVWLPGQDMFREISSCSVCGEFQARRMGARYRAADRSVRHVHTLNGSGVAVGRALIAVMENYQNADGSITVPEALRPYMGGLARIEKAA